MLHKDKPASHETDCGSLECACGARNRFFRGKRMKAKEFTIEQAYGIERRRLVNRSVIGWGVVCGFNLDGPRRAADHEPTKQQAQHTHQTASGPTEVGRGFALDRKGREIVLVDPVKLGPDNTFLLETGASGCRTLPLEQAEPGRYVLAIHYAEHRFGDANLPGLCGCHEPEQNYVCETAVWSLRPLGECACPCGEPPCERKCACEAVDSCGHGRGPHACVCHWLENDCVGDCKGTLCDWQGYAIDPADGVDLACVHVVKTDDKCRPVTIVVEDPCGPRRFVKNNDLLYDFIRGCDLTRISWVSWHDWHRAMTPMPWQTFADMFHADDGWTSFVVKFSAPVLKDTIRFDTVVMRAITIEQSTEWRIARRVPIVDLDLTPEDAKIPADTTDRLRLFVSEEWVKDEIEKGRASWLSDRGFEIEIEIFGDGILDCHRQPIDGNAIGIVATPSGNGTPGGTYRSSFRVSPKPRKAELA